MVYILALQFYWYVSKINLSVVAGAVNMEQFCTPISLHNAKQFVATVFRRK